jgi:hypothetical protein
VSIPLDSLPRALALYLGLDHEQIEELCEKAPTSYKRFSVLKANGVDRRAILQPSHVTKSAQYALLDLFLADLPVNSAAMAYRPGLRWPLLANATLHSRYEYSVCLDFTSFFPSIQPKDFIVALQTSNRGPVSDPVEQLLSRTLFARYPDGKMRLAIGAPSSPCIANVIMRSLDESFLAFARAQDAAYTRYADDLTFSAHSRAECRRFLQFVKETLAACESPRLRLNRQKTRFQSVGGRRTITGLCVAGVNHVTIGRARKRYYRRLIKDAIEGKLDDQARLQLRGFLVFAASVEPAFINQCILKYGANGMRDILPHRSV